MIRIAFILVFLLTGRVIAQEINIRSGAHDNFARLVLDAPLGAKWNLQQESNGVELNIQGHQDGFDTSSVFERIDRSFISSVSSDASSIRVEFGCDCSAEVFDAGSGMIALDVSVTSPAGDNPLDESSLDFVGHRSLSFGLNGRETPALQIQGTLPSQSIIPIIPRVVSKKRNINALPYETIQLPPNLGAMNDARIKIAKHLGTAASRGLLDPASGRIQVPIEISPAQRDIQIPESVDEAVAVSGTDNQSISNVRISTSESVVSTFEQNMSSSISEGVNCIEPQRIDIKNWGKEHDMIKQISRLRSQLYGEFDVLNAQVAFELVRTYLYFGFGAEARQILFLDRDLGNNNPELLEMAEIFEYGYSPSSEYLAQFIECESDAALWAVMSSPSVDPTKSVNVNAVLRSASALPLHLRTIIVPTTSKRLLDYGDLDAASAALRSLERAPQALTPHANLAKADLEIANKSTTQAQERLVQIITSNTAQSAKALIKFVDSHLSEEAEIDENVATLVEAYAQEMRDDPLEVELRRTHVLALAKSGQFSAAFDALQRMQERRPQSGEDTLRSSVLDLLVSNSADIDFLEHAFEQIENAPKKLTEAARIKLAERIFSLGFPRRAETLLSSDFVDQETAALLRAKISIALDKPLEALSHLFGLESEEASILRSRAQALAGNYSIALQNSLDLADEKNIMEMAWLAQDWSTVLDASTPIFGPMVSLAQNRLEGQDEREGMLERTGNAISESQNAREVIQNLLRSNELQLPELD